MAGRHRVLLACAALLALASGCPSRQPYGVPDGGPEDAGPPPPDARPPVVDAGPPVCGDGLCGDGEWCVCLVDCGECHSECGDGWCHYGEEDCTTCPSECGTCPGTCGDGRCDDIEGCWTCVADCGTCIGCDHGVCEAGPALLATCDPCAAGVCTAMPSCCTVEWDQSCVAAADIACHAGCTPPVCGDLVCDREDLETCYNCPQDCECLACEHSACEQGAPLAADCAPCVMTVCTELRECCREAWTQPCVQRLMETCWGGCGGFCGDGICGADELCCDWCSPCEADCGALPGGPPCCGNGICGDGPILWVPETCSNCSADCACCGDGICSDAGESCNSCPGDCGACLASCGDGVCVRNQGENCATCPPDCPTCP